MTDAQAQALEREVQALRADLEALRAVRGVGLPLWGKCDAVLRVALPSAVLAHLSQRGAKLGMSNSEQARLFIGAGLYTKAAVENSLQAALDGIDD